MCVYMHIYMCIYMYIYICVCVYMYIYVCVCRHSSILDSYHPYHCKKVSLTAKLFALIESVLALTFLIRDVTNEKTVYMSRDIVKELFGKINTEGTKNTKK